MSKSEILLERDEVLKWFGDSDWYKTFHKASAADFSSIVTLIEENKL
ncbi:hypothetical protein ACFSKU_10165 [Pontibacter silvestris]|uniref:Uncharacterized protein n=1 Tax=Pontibacter silvestris TaxID=2305183 RepID=A0ABW4WX04_9BACT|nr:hypothetical protein [Pontibacter silvestris]MCC9136797.1 hypothetical protein [Pontibacter silvestris]